MRNLMNDPWGQLTVTNDSILVNILVALAILLIGWLLARLISGAIGKLIKKSSVDKKVTDTTTFRLSTFVQKLVYYILMLFVLLAVLGRLGINEVLVPIQNLLNSFVAALPSIIYAFIVGVFGYFIAKIVSELVGLGAGTIERVAIKMNMSKPSSLVSLLKRIVFIIIFVPILIQAIDLLQLDAIADPAKSMLYTFIDAIPNIIAAIIIVGLFFFVGRYVTNLLKDVLKSVGTDSFVHRLGLGTMVGTQSTSNLIGNIAFFFIMFIGIITGVEKLHLYNLADILRNLLDISGSILFGLVILVFGNYISIMIYNNINRSHDGKFIANIARYAVLGMFIAISLRAMGIANEIVQLAFGLTLGAVAVAFALMFGLGGRQAAGKHVEYILEKFRRDK